MYIEAVPNRSSPPAILLRESYRDGGRVKKRTMLNLSDWPPTLVAGMRALLKGGTVTGSALPADGAPVTHSARPIDLAANRAPAGLVALLGIIAIVALSLVTAMYARLYLIRRQAG